MEETEAAHSTQTQTRQRAPTYHAYRGPIRRLETIGQLRQRAKNYTRATDPTAPS